MSVFLTDEAIVCFVGKDAGAPPFRQGGYPTKGPAPLSSYGLPMAMWVFKTIHFRNWRDPKYVRYMILEVMDKNLSMTTLSLPMGNSHRKAFAPLYLRPFAGVCSATPEKHPLSRVFFFAIHRWVGIPRGLLHRAPFGRLVDSHYKLRGPCQLFFHPKD